MVLWRQPRIGAARPTLWVILQLTFTFVPLNYPVGVKRSSETFQKGFRKKGERCTLSQSWTVMARTVAQLMS